MECTSYGKGFAVGLVIVGDSKNGASPVKVPPRQVISISILYWQAQAVLLIHTICKLPPAMDCVEMVGTDIGEQASALLPRPIIKTIARTKLLSLNLVNIESLL